MKAIEYKGDLTMKKITSIVLAGAVMLSLGACSGGSRPSDSQVTTTEATTTEATTTTTTEETTTEETTSASSSESETSKSFDEQIPSDGEVFIACGDWSANKIADNILSALRLRTGTTAESFANRFSTPPKYSYSKGVWKFTWGKVKPETNMFGDITIKAGKEDNKIVLDKDSSIKFKIYIEDSDIGTSVYERLSSQIGPDGDSADYLKTGLAINPRRCWKNTSRLYRYQKYDFKWVEITLECKVMSLPESDKE